MSRAGLPSNMKLFPFRQIKRAFADNKNGEKIISTGMFKQKEVKVSTIIRHEPCI
jgi:hypothetical protein